MYYLKIIYYENTNHLKFIDTYQNKKTVRIFEIEELIASKICKLKLEILLVITQRS